MSRPLQYAALFLCFSATARADSWDDFANNLATDLAPLIQLFGEAVTKQFLSESLDILDNIIFACAPLGVLTAVVSAIRVCGSPSLKAFIGRAQESQGASELELLSCTSSTTSELYSDGSIARTFGQPDINEFVYVGREAERAAAESVRLKRAGSDDPEVERVESDFQKGLVGSRPVKVINEDCGIQRLDEVLDDLHTRAIEKMRPRPPTGVIKLRNGSVLPIKEEEKPTTKSSATLYGWQCLERQSDLREDQPPGRPNLSINVGINRLPRIYFYMAAIFGFCLQVAVLVFAAITVYIQPENFLKNGEFVPSYGFPLTVVGTVMLCVGMFMCAYLIERSTIEDYFLSDGQTQVWWIQPGGQMIGDQKVDAYIGRLEADRYLRSRRDPTYTPHFFLWSAVVISSIGFVLQFVGLRALHSSVTLFQLGGTLLMAVIRASLRTSRMKSSRNLIPRTSQPGINEFLKGRELDMLSMHMVREMISVASVNQSMPADRMPRLFWTKVLAKYLRIPRPLDRSDEDFKTSKIELVKVRARVGALHEESSENGGQTESSILTGKLRETIENCAKVLESVSCLGKSDEPGIWSWQIVLYDDLGPKMQCLNYTLTLERQGQSEWTLRNPYDLHALIGLWSLGSKWLTHRLIIEHDGTSSGYGVRDYEAWIRRRTSPETNLRAVYDLAGFPSRLKDNGDVIVRLHGPPDRHRAQDLFMLFIEEAVKNGPSLPGKTTVRQETAIQPNCALPLENSTIERLATVFENASLGSREEAYMVIVPALMRRAKLPKLETVHKEVLRRAANTGNIDALNLLIEHGLQNGYVDEAKSTALHLASKRERSVVVRTLITSGVLVNAATTNGDTALHFAARFGRVSNVSALLEDRSSENAKSGQSRANINACNNEHQTPLFVATRHRKKAVVVQLLRSGADVHIPDNENVSPLLCATLTSSRGIIRALLERGADQEQRDNHGWAPSYAAWALKDRSRLRMLQHLSIGRSPLGIPPTRWDDTDDHTAECVEFSEHGITAQVVKKEHPSSANVAVPERLRLRANHPVPIGKYVFYFEVTFASLLADSVAGIGFSVKNQDARMKLPGWSRYSWGYHSDDGKKFHGRGAGHSYGPKFGTGDVVGCGISYKSRTIFYTLNGRLLGTAFWKVRGRLWPVVVLGNERNAKVEANFQGPFKWTGTYDGPERSPHRGRGDMVDDDTLELNLDGASSSDGTSSEDTESDGDSDSGEESDESGDTNESDSSIVESSDSESTSDDSSGSDSESSRRSTTSSGSSSNARRRPTGNAPRGSRNTGASRFKTGRAAPSGEDAAPGSSRPQGSGQRAATRERRGNRRQQGVNRPGKAQDNNPPATTEATASQATGAPSSRKARRRRKAAVNSDAGASAT